MAYPHYQDGKPDSTTDDGDAVVDNVRQNLDALRDAVTMGVMPDWDYSIVVGTGTNEYPDEYHFTKGQERIKLVNTWNGDNNLASFVASYTSNHTVGTYDTIGTYTITYTSGIPTAGAWT